MRCLSVCYRITCSSKCPFRERHFLYLCHQSSSIAHNSNSDRILKKYHSCNPMLNLQTLLRTLSVPSGEIQCRRRSLVLLFLRGGISPAAAAAATGGEGAVHAAVLGRVRVSVSPSLILHAARGGEAARQAVAPGIRTGRKRPDVYKRRERDYRRRGRVISRSEVGLHTNSLQNNSRREVVAQCSFLRHDYDMTTRLEWR